GDSVHPHLAVDLAVELPDLVAPLIADDLGRPVLELRREPPLEHVGWFDQVVVDGDDGVADLPRLGLGEEEVLDGRRHHLILLHLGRVTPTPETVAELLVARADDEDPALLFGEDSWSWREVVAESARRAALANELRRPGPFHVGVLLENGPEYLFWLGGAALSGATVVGINPTRRGAELARDIRHTDCHLTPTDSAGRPTLADLDSGVDDDRILVVDGDSRGNSWRNSTAISSRLPDQLPDPSSLIVLLFTSGSTGAPKAVKCSQRRLAMIGRRASELYGFRRDDV